MSLVRVQIGVAIKHKTLSPPTKTCQQSLSWASQATGPATRAVHSLQNLTVSADEVGIGQPGMQSPCEIRLEAVDLAWGQVAQVNPL